MTALFLFLLMYLGLRPSFSLVSRPYAVSLLPHRTSVFFFTKFSPACFQLCFILMVSISQRCLVGTPSPSGQSRYHRLLLVLPNPSSFRRGVPISFRSHSNSLRSVISCPSSFNSFFRFRFDQAQNLAYLCCFGEYSRPYTCSLFRLLPSGRLSLPLLLRAHLISVAHFFYSSLSV